MLRRMLIESIECDPARAEGNYLPPPPTLKTSNIMNRTPVCLSKCMRDFLENMVLIGRNRTDTIGTGVEEIASGNIDLSSHTKQQAASLDETASSREQTKAT